MAMSAAAAAAVGPPRLRLVHFNDVYELSNLSRLQTFLSQVQPDATVLSGDFLSPSTLSSVDGGKGMIATLRAIGLTHCCLGNHEADLRLPDLHKRLKKLSKSAVVLNSNIGRNVVLGSSSSGPVEKKRKKKDGEGDWMVHADWMPEYSVISTPCQRVQVALAGLLSDEPGVFPNGSFRGVPIGSVTDTYSKLYEQLIATGTVHMILPLTHQFVERDKELARHMLRVASSNSSSSSSSSSSSCGTGGLILGGHEHTPYDVTVADEDHPSSSSSVRILKSGMEADAVDLVDLTFDPETLQLTELKAELVEMKDFEPSVVVGSMVKEYMRALEDLENEAVVRADSLLPPGKHLSSIGTRYRQTTVGGIFCTAIKDELEADVALINGATIKGNTAYAGTCMSYAALKQELPFPTKMVVVPMKRWELHEVVHYSRTRNPDVSSEETNENDDGGGVAKVERKGYLQVDTEFDRLGFHTGDQDDELLVALPRNLLNGFCNIRPLMEIGDRLKEADLFPDKDAYIKAIDLVVRHFCKAHWFELSGEMDFDDLDSDRKGFLTRDDVKRLLRERIGHEPADFVVDDMIAAIDDDCNGVIDPGEFSHLLADMERQQRLIRFD